MREKKPTNPTKSVGSVVLDMMSKSESPLTAGDILDGFSEKYIEVLKSTVDKEAHRYKSPFYVLVLSAKEMWAPNLVRNWFVARQTAPIALDMVELYPNHTKTLYSIVKEGQGEITLCWTLPGLPECESILKSPYLYHEDLVRWIKECFSGTLEPVSA